MVEGIFAQVLVNCEGTFHESLNRLRFLDLLDGPQSDLYDRRTGRGWIIILYNPVQIASSSGISFLALGSSWSESSRRARVDLPIRLRQIVTRRAETGPVSVRVEIRHQQFPATPVRLILVLPF